MLRRGYYVAASTTTQHSSSAYVQHDHASHCFDYLRQSIACAADTALEPRNKQHSGVQGWGVEHRCRNFEAVKEWAERWRSDDNDGIAN